MQKGYYKIQKKISYNSKISLIQQFKNQSYFKGTKIQGGDFSSFLFYNIENVLAYILLRN